MKEAKIVKKGTKDWWTTIVMLRVALRQRQAGQIPENEPVTFSTEDINAEIEYLNRHTLTRIWILLTNGDVTEKAVVSALGDMVRFKVKGG